MKPQALNEESPPLQEVTTSVCIIGAGVAGLVAARRLAKAGVPVILLESGGEGLDLATQEYNRVEDVFNSHGGSLSGRFRGLGGSSIQWGGRLLPLNPADVAPRPHVNAAGWPIGLDELNRYESEINQLFSLDTSTYEESVLDESATRFTLPRNDADIHVRLPKWVAFSRCNVGRLLREEIDALPELAVWLNSTVCEFEFSTETRRLISVTSRNIQGKRLRVTAKEFLVAGGTIESTRLLLLLDAATGGNAFAGCRVLGRYFQDHLGTRVADLVPRDHAAINLAMGYRFIKSVRRSLHFELSDHLQQQERVASGFAHVTMVPTENSSTDVLKRFLRGLQNGKFAMPPREMWKMVASSGDLFKGAYWRFGRKMHYWPADLKHQLNVWIEQLPDWDNRITLSERRDVFGVPQARLEWRKTDVDERTFRACIRHFKDYWQRHELDRFCELAWIPEAAGSTGSIAALASDLLHPSGSTRMGTDPAESVVGPDLRCHTVSNLTLASASVFPTAGSANPTYTILQIAFRATDGVLARVRGTVS